MSEYERNPEEIEREIEVTRERMSRDNRSEISGERMSRFAYTGVAVLGLAAGLPVPETERERRIMGPEEISHRAPELKSTLKDAAQTVTQQVKESAGRVKEEAKQAARESSAGRDPTA